jgi:cell volume regulation protein A
MANALMIAAGSAVLLSYWFLHLGRQIRVPSVVLLLLAGLALRAITHAYGATINVPSEWLRVLGAVGLVLIVLEASLDLNLDVGHRPLLMRSFGSAALGLVVTVAAITAALTLGLHLTWYHAALLALPFAIIGSSIAIPGAEGLSVHDRSFVVFESSWSDIIGVMGFNALLSAGNPYGTTIAVSGEIVAAFIIGSIIGLGMLWLIGHLSGSVKFLPLLFALIFIYGTASALDFSPLLVVLILGLILNNSGLLSGVRWLDRLGGPRYDDELTRFKLVTAEATFVVRTFFFLLLGYTTNIQTLSDSNAWWVAAVLMAVILLLRWPILFLINEQRTRPLLWAIPRGLITTTLFFAVPPGDSAGLPPGTLVLVILLSCLVMTIGFQIDGKHSAPRRGTDF